MYSPLLIIHSLLRWAVLALGAMAFARAVAGARARRGWTAADDRAGLWFSVIVDIQFLLGLALYVKFSPMTQIAFQDFGAAMANPVLRFWAVEHALGMIVGIALVHIGRVRIRKTADAAKRHRLAAIFFGLGLAAMLLTIPWPGTPAARPFFHF